MMRLAIMVFVHTVPLYKLSRENILRLAFRKRLWYDFEHFSPITVWSPIRKCEPCKPGINYHLRLISVVQLRSTCNVCRRYSHISIFQGSF
jgi:hypothetical protein